VTRAALVAAALLAFQAGCTTVRPLGEDLLPTAPGSVELVSTPFFPQQVHECGPASLAAVLTAAGHPASPEELVDQLIIPARRGSLQAEMLAATRRAGLMPYVLPANTGAILAELSEGRPVIVLQNLGVESWPLWHYAVAIGYDAGRGVAILRSGTDRRLEMRWPRFVRAWQRGGRWAFSVLAPGSMPAAVEPALFLEAAAGLETSGRLEEAAASYRAAAERWPDAPLPWLGLGNVAYARGDLQAAVGDLERGVARAPGNASLRNNLAQVMLDAGCAAAALAHAREAAELARDTPLATVAAETLADAERMVAEVPPPKCSVIHAAGDPP